MGGYGGGGSGSGFLQQGADMMAGLDDVLPKMKAKAKAGRPGQN